MDASSQTVAQYAAFVESGTTAKSVPAPGHEWWRKPLRTAIQLVMGGGLSLLLSWLTSTFGGTVTPGELGVLALIFAQLTSMAQNYGESRGWIPTYIVPPAPRVTAVTTTQPSVPITAAAPDQPAPAPAVSNPPPAPTPQSYAPNRTAGPAPTASPGAFANDPAATL